MYFPTFVFVSLHLQAIIVMIPFTTTVIVICLGFGHQNLIILWIGAPHNRFHIHRFSLPYRNENSY